MKNYGQKNFLFPNIYELEICQVYLSVKLVLTLPHSNAELERIFSIVN